MEVPQSQQPIEEIQHGQDWHFESGEEVMEALAAERAARNGESESESESFGSVSGWIRNYEVPRVSARFERIRSRVEKKSSRDKMNTMIERIKTFNTWPRQIKQRPEELAKAGFFYTGVGDNVECYQCNIKWCDMLEDAVPMEEHAVLSPFCEFLKATVGKACVKMMTLKRKLSSSSQENKKLEDKKKMNNNDDTISTSEPGNEKTPSKGKELYSLTCGICLDEEHKADVALYECGHLMCSECVLRISTAGRCPYCQRDYVDILKIFF